MMNNNSISCSLKYDLFKLKKQKSVWIGLAIMFAITLIIYCVYWAGLSMISNVDPGSDPEAISMQQQLLLMLEPLGKTSLVGFSETCAMSLFVAIITCLFIGKDFSDGAIRLAVSRGANRTKLYLSKLITLSVLVVAYSVFAILICGIFTSFLGFGEPFGALQFGLLVRCFVLQTLCNLSTMSIVVMIAFLCRSSGYALGATIGGSIALSLIFGLISTVGALAGNSTWIMFMPLQQNTIAASIESYSASELCAVIIMPLVYGGIATAIGMTSFLKRDIK